LCENVVVDIIDVTKARNRHTRVQRERHARPLKGFVSLASMSIEAISVRSWKRVRHGAAEPMQVLSYLF
jgi:hypothetical protein